MNFDAIRASFNAKAKNNIVPPLWSASEVDDLINLAYVEAADRGLLIFDRSSFQINVKANVQEYTLDPLIIKIKRLLNLHTMVASASIVSAGTGGTPGAALLDGTTGTGGYFQLAATISAGGVIASIDSIPIPGDYTVNPTNVNAEPVTGGNLTNATVSLTMTENLDASIPMILVAREQSGLDWSRIHFWDRPWEDGYYIEEDHTLVLSPPPETDATLQIDAWRYPSAKLANPTDVPEFDEIYHDKMLSYALKLAYQKQDAETSDMMKAKDYEDDFTRWFGPPRTAQARRMARNGRPYRVRVKGY